MQFKINFTSIIQACDSKQARL